MKNRKICVRSFQWATFLEVGIVLPPRGLQLENFKRFPKYREWGLYRYSIMAYILIDAFL